MRNLGAFAALFVVAACSITAPPAEDISGDAIAVENGRLTIDDTKVPVLDECAVGEVVTRTDVGWECIDLVASSVTAGDGLTGGGSGAVNVAVDFGDGATQVASGERVVALEAASDAAIVVTDALEVSVAALQARPLTDLFIATCDGTATGGLGFQAGSLVVCDGTQFRDVLLAEPPPPLLIGDFNVAGVSGLVWANNAGGEPLALVTNISSVQITGPPVVTGIGRLGAAGFGGPIGQMELALPTRDFSIEIVVQGSEQYWQHGSGDSGLSVESFGGNDVNVRESGLSTRYQSINPIDAIPPNHFIYVHDANDNRSMHVNGRATTVAIDNGAMSGPYLGGKGIFTIGSRFGAAAGNQVFFRLTIHGHALDAGEIAAACNAVLVAGLILSCS